MGSLFGGLEIVCSYKVFILESYCFTGKIIKELPLSVCAIMASLSLSFVFMFLIVFAYGFVL